MMRRRSRRSLALVCFALLIAKVTPKKHNHDDRNNNWGLPNKNSSQHGNSSNNNKSKQPEDSDDDPSNNPFKPSFTLFPQSDLTSNLNALFHSNNEEKKHVLLSRLHEFVREEMLDQEEVNKLVNRTRKEWEDQTVEQQARAIEGMMKIGSILLGSPPIRKLMSSREAQESLRQFVVSIKLLLEDPEKEFVFGDSDRWHEMFEKLKQWEGASPDRLLESLLEFLEHHSPDK